MGEAPTLGFGERFFDFFRKMAFLGDVFVKKIDFFGNLLPRKSTALEIKQKLFLFSDLIHVAHSPFVRYSVLTPPAM